MRSLAGVTGVVLAGGFGTRLRSVVADRPKVLALVNGRPFVERLLDQLVDAGVQSAVLCTGYLAEQVEAALGTHYRGMALHYSREDTPLGTGGAIRAALPWCATQSLVVVNGDSYCHVNLIGAYEAQQRHPAEACIVVHEVDDTSRFGRVATDAAGRVRQFEEKTAATGAGLINAGIYLLPTARVEMIPEGREVSLEREIFPRWLETGLYAYRADGPFIDIGTPESYRAAEQFFAS